MAEFDLEKLQEIKVPDASQAARQKTLQSALYEFDEQQKQKNAFSLFASIPDWIKSSYVLLSTFNPRIAGASALVLLVVISASIYIPNIEKQNTPVPAAEQDKNTAEKASPIIKENEIPLSIKNSPDHSPKKRRTRQFKSKVKPLSIGNNHGLTNKNRTSGYMARPGGQSAQHREKKKPSSIQNSSGASKQPKTSNIQNFSTPQFKGKRLHYCLSLKKKCGKPAADMFCKYKKLGKSTSFVIGKAVQLETISIQTGTIFKKSAEISPLGFKTISCLTPEK